ncbi:MAG: amino acid ABC transporter substrate-binding protein, partial [Stellaceae bacterium]
SSNGAAALVAMKVWEANANAKGGLLGRPVKLIYYDDQSNPAQVPGIYTKLLDVDKVDLVIGGYGTNLVAPAMPVVMQHGRTFIGLLALDVNKKFHYPRYFAMAPTGGPHPSQSITQPFFSIAARLTPKPKTIALVGADAEFPKHALDGAREQSKEAGYRIVYDRSYPPNTADYSPIVRAIQARKPDLVCVASYPPDSVGMIRAAREEGLKTRLFGGGMVGPQATSIKTQLGDMLNGVTCYDFWLPIGKFATPEALAFLKQYQAKAGPAGVDSLGYYLPPFAYSDLQVLAQAVTATKGTDDEKLANYMHATTFNPIVGPIKFRKGGEWTEARVLEAQFQGVKGHGVDQFKNLKTEVILYPEQYKSGTLHLPYQDALH